MTKQTFVSSLKFSAPLTTAGIRTEIRVHSAQWEIWRMGSTYADAIFPTFYATSRLHK